MILRSGHQHRQLSFSPEARTGRLPSNSSDRSEQTRAQSLLTTDSGNALRMNTSSTVPNTSSTVPIIKFSQAASKAKLLAAKRKVTSINQLSLYRFNDPNSIPAQSGQGMFGDLSSTTHSPSSNTLNLPQSTDGSLLPDIAYQSKPHSQESSPGQTPSGSRKVSKEGRKLLGIRPAIDSDSNTAP